ncbi:hypothetical protein Emed_001618 [Eimeria media]
MDRLLAATAGMTSEMSSPTPPSPAEVPTDLLQLTNTASAAATEELKYDWRTMWTYGAGASSAGAAPDEEGARVPDEIDGPRRRRERDDSDSEEQEKEVSVDVEREAGRGPRAADSEEASHADTHADEANDTLEWHQGQVSGNPVKGTKATLWGTVLLLVALLRLFVGAEEDGEQQQRHQTDSASPLSRRAAADLTQSRTPTGKETSLMLAGFGLGLMASGLLEMLGSSQPKPVEGRGKRGPRRGAPPPRVRGLSVLLMAMLVSMIVPQQQQQRDDDGEDNVDNLRPFSISTAKLSFAAGLALAAGRPSRGPSLCGLLPLAPQSTWPQQQPQQQQQEQEQQLGHPAQPQPQQQQQQQRQQKQQQQKRISSVVSAANLALSLKISFFAHLAFFDKGDTETEIMYFL